jgi:TRAP-type transport system small permease protein
MKKRVGKIQKTLEWAMAIALAIMVVLVFCNAFARYVLNSGLSSSEEISRLAFVWLIFLGAIVGVREKKHVSVNMFLNKAPLWLQRISMMVCNVLILIALFLFAKGSYTQSVIGLGTVLPVTGIPQAAFSLAGLFASVAMGALFVIETLRLLLGRVSNAEFQSWINEVPDHDPT